jgi:hypothetical protein
VWAENDLVEENSEKECPHLASLEKDYEDFLKWTFSSGKPGDKWTRSEARKAWEKHHPSLPMPRYFELRKPALSPDAAILLLMFDAYPLYLAEKK